MAIQIHIRVRESDWQDEHKLANAIADKIVDIIPEDVNIPVLVLSVEDPENEMEDLHLTYASELKRVEDEERSEEDSESKYLEAVRRADIAEQTEW